jgi:hypothetical protein
VRSLFSEYVVDGIEAPPNFSLVLAADHDRAFGRGLNLLYRSYSNVVRSRRVSRPLLGLAAYLADFLPPEPDSDLLTVEVGVLVRDGRALLVPPLTRTWTDILTPRLHRQRFQFVDARFATLDPTTAELVVPQPRLTLADEPLADLMSEQSKEPDPVEPGRYPIEGWAFFTYDERDVDRMSTAEGTAYAARYVMGHHEAASVARQLAHLLRKAHPTAIGSPFRGDLASKIASVVAA